MNDNNGDKIGDYADDIELILLLLLILEMIDNDKSSGNNDNDTNKKITSPPVGVYK